MRRFSATSQSPTNRSRALQDVRRELLNQHRHFLSEHSSCPVILASCAEILEIDDRLLVRFQHDIATHFYIQVCASDA